VHSQTCVVKKFAKKILNAIILSGKPFNVYKIIQISSSGKHNVLRV
jgi:hypothetical protein